MLERVFRLIPTIADLQTQVITIQGNEPYLEEKENYRFQAEEAIFKVPNMELANKLVNMRYNEKLEFTLHLSRMIDRLFVKEKLPYVSSFVFIKQPLIQRHINYIFNQRFPSSQYTNVINFINYLGVREREDDFYIVINRSTPQLLQFIEYQFDNPAVADHHKFVFDVRHGLPNEFEQSELFKLQNKEPETENDMLVLYKSLFLRPLSREDFNTLLPIIDFAIMELLYLRFELNPAARDMLSLSLSNTFTIKERKPGKISASQKEALENNEYNYYDDKAHLAISALAIVGANQEGLRYYSGFTDPRQILSRMQNRYNTNPELNLYPRLMQ